MQTCLQIDFCKSEWTWNKTFKELYRRSEALIMKKACMTFYNEKKTLFLKTEASGVGLEAGLLQVRHGINCLKGKAPGNTIL